MVIENFLFLFFDYKFCGPVTKMFCKRFFALVNYFSRLIIRYFFSVFIIIPVNQPVFVHNFLFGIRIFRHRHFFDKGFLFAWAFAYCSISISGQKL
ncbi:MAG TPA: hypothetical protein DDY32_01530 [Desulfobulbaceae bacterium]|nr:hypothetical protein [Desulfobulbaceae bacterium]